GCYARSGLLSDVQLYEEYPARYLTDIARQQRWVRGDWQIVNWLFPKVPNAEGHNERNPLSMLSQWKILDNLRRSLLPIVFTILLLVGWFGFSQPWRWTLVVLAIALIPPILAGVVDALRRPQEVLYRRHLVSILRSARQNLTLSLFRLACLPFEAWINLSAILRTTLRVLVTRKRLLEWQVVSDKSCPEASHPDFRVAKNVLDRDPIVAAYRAMWIAPAVALSVTLASGFSGLAVLIGVMPVAAMWLLAPFFSWWFSKPLMRHTHTFRDGQLLYLRRIARKTWSFFDCFVSARNHWLPPDNFQEHPGPKEAHRTSPTNIGLSLLANVSAADFGYISIGALLKRCTDTFATLNKLERYQGHFFNWYDTETLQPLPPRYISSVDSGNLAGHLLTLRAALLELPTQAILS
ncbi:MAG: cyclic beta 1-2 glucan synthetase, partial [Gammaproteobacteria bacterium]